jgi:2-phosphoglycerate kinase
MKFPLLLGGGSSVGKTTAALSLSERLGVACIHLDQYLSQINDPGLDFPSGNAVWNFPAQNLCKHLIAAGENAQGYIQFLLQTWQNEGKIGIIEGERITPLLVDAAAQTKTARGIFIIEDDPQKLYRTLQERSKKFLVLAEPQKKRVVEMDCAYNRWLHSEVERRSLPWVTSQPWNSLVERILERVIE